MQGATGETKYKKGSKNEADTDPQTEILSKLRVETLGILFLRRQRVETRKKREMAASQTKKKKRKKKRRRITQRKRKRRTEMMKMMKMIRIIRRRETEKGSRKTEMETVK